ncbi:MAG: TerB family tellurite resistance protein [bacterium]
MARFKGKVMGAWVGAMLGGPLGALIGGAIGHYVKDLPDEELDGAGPVSRDSREFTEYSEFIFMSNLVALLTAVAKADGEVTRDEVRTIREFFQNQLGYSGEDLMMVKDLIKEAIRTDINIAEICRQFNSYSSYQTKLLLLKLLHMVAYADRVITDREERIIRLIVGSLKIRSADYHRMRAAYTNDDNRYYEILGVSPHASQDEIKKAYRELAHQYHPDKVAHLGPEYVKIANKQLSEINEAYSKLRDSGNKPE